METANVKKSNHGANVRRWREWRNINQDVLAEQIGVSQATLSSYEKKNKLEQDILEKIAKALNIPVEAITELGEDSTINIVASTLTANDNAAIINYYPTFNPIDKIVELYDKLLQSENRATAPNFSISLVSFIFESWKQLFHLTSREFATHV